MWEVAAAAYSGVWTVIQVVLELQSPLHTGGFLKKPVKRAGRQSYRYTQIMYSINWCGRNRCSGGIWS